MSHNQICHGELHGQPDMHSVDDTANDGHDQRAMPVRRTSETYSEMSEELIAMSRESCRNHDEVEVSDRSQHSPGRRRHTAVSDACSYGPDEYVFNVLGQEVLPSQDRSGRGSCVLQSIAISTEA